MSLDVNVEGGEVEQEKWEVASQKICKEICKTSLQIVVERRKECMQTLKISHFSIFL